MKVELRAIETIRPYENNPRINDDAVDAVAASLQAFGFKQPIVVDADGTIVVGHTRYRATLKLGLTHVPVHVATDLSPAQVKAYRIADNATAALAEWNMELLPIELAGLKAMDFDLGLLGFDDEELLRIMSGDVADGLVHPDDVPAPPDAAVTQRGDLWVLGEHRLLCGDSGKPENVDRLLDGAVVDLVNTDPPYGVAVEPRSGNAIAAGLFVQARLWVPLGDPGCLSLFLPDPACGGHRMVGEHLASEGRIRTQGRGREVDEWRLRQPGLDNHWLDCLVGCAVAASMQGAVLFGTGSTVRRMRTRVKLSELQKNKKHWVPRLN